MPTKTPDKYFNLYYCKDRELYGIYRYAGVIASRKNKEEEPELAKETNMVFYFKTQYRNHQTIKKLISRVKEILGCTHVVAAPGRTPEPNTLQKLFGADILTRKTEVPSRKYYHDKPVTQEWKESIVINWKKLNRNSIILLVDDYIISGHSIEALAELLQAKGHTVVKLGLGISPKLINPEHTKEYQTESDEPRIAINNKEMPVKALEAFELFYALGENRSMNRLITQYPEKKYNRRAIRNWQTEYNWQKLIKDRDTAVTQVINDTAVLSVAEEKTKAIYETNNLLDSVRELINQSFTVDPVTGKITTNLIVSTVKEFKMVVDSFEKLTKLKMFLFGEDMGETDNRVINLQIIQNNTVIEERQIDLSEEIEDAETT
jgi:hypoxanthine phosphoribosyltransferase